MTPLLPLLQGCCDSEGVGNYGSRLAVSVGLPVFRCVVFTVGVGLNLGSLSDLVRGYSVFWWVCF